MNRPEGARPEGRAPLDSARTHGSNVTSLPGHWGPSGLRWETVRREGDRLGRSRRRARSRWTVLPSLLRHDGREGEGGTLCHRHRRATLAHCYHWLFTTGPTAPQLGGVALASLFSFGSSLWRGQWQGEFKDCVY